MGLGEDRRRVLHRNGKVGAGVEKENYMWIGSHGWMEQMNLVGMGRGGAWK